MPRPDHAVIAAAGFGSRLGRGHPKCLLEVAGKPLLRWQLDLLTDVPDVRVVVGFQEDAVTDLARRLRPDVTIVRNPAFAGTSALASYALGGRYVAEPCLFMDGDIIFDPVTFQAFCERAGDRPLVGYTDAKTQDPVYVDIDEPAQLVRGFSRTDVSAFEWANLLCVPGDALEQGLPGRPASASTVFEYLRTQLAPVAGLGAAYLRSYEIDRPQDLAVAIAALAPGARPSAGRACRSASRGCS
ncbi:MAG: hypothetical protein CSB46_09100 [Micrococcales bacterium]|nr:MAG: hypothetical protein CSB46_09100 [Micrococcales bacterium]